MSALIARSPIFQSSDGGTSSRTLTLLAVIVIHGGLLWLFIEADILFYEAAPPVVPAVVLVPVAATRHRADIVLLPDVLPTRQLIDQSMLSVAQFIDPDADIVPGVIAPQSAPHVDTSRSLDAARYALRAGMAAGQAATVILGIEVRADGTVGDVSVVIGAGNVAIDAEAIAYVRALHWIPGSVGRHAQTMRLRWPVTLRVNTSDESEG